MFTNTLKIVSLVFATWFVNGCAAKSAQQGDKSGGVTPVQQVTQGESGCAPINPAAPQNPNKWTGRIINTRTLMMSRTGDATNSGKVSACDALLQTNKKVAIFQFSGVLCLACYDEAKAIQAKIATLPNGAASVQHFLVFVDNPQDRTPAEAQEFITKHTGGQAQILYDIVEAIDKEGGKSLWRIVAKNSQSPAMGATFIMNNLGHYADITEGAQLPSLLPQMDALLNSAQ